MPGVFAGRSSRNYDRMARWVLPRAYRRLAADVDAFAPVGGSVLDVGIGPGILLRELGRRRADLRLTGVDLSADMIAAAARNLAPFGGRARTMVGDVTAMPFADEIFDLVTTSFSLHTGTTWARPGPSWPGCCARAGGSSSTTSPSRRSTNSPRPRSSPPPRGRPCAPACHS